ncbi:MAG: hypothetical protein HFF31_05455 [Flavonifractor sp.]|nr:hypothetical protein [Flavonifractor sp.]
MYLMEYTGTIPEDSVLEVEENKIGVISGGATLEYKPTFYTVEDDLGTVKEALLTAEEVTFKSGLLAPNMSFAAFSAPTARVEPATAQKKRRVTKIGGVANADGKSYIVRFLHASTADPGYKLRATIVGVNTSGFSLGFLKDKETIVDLTFAAQPMDGTGTLVELDEPDDPVEGGA